MRRVFRGAAVVASAALLVVDLPAPVFADPVSVPPVVGQQPVSPPDERPDVFSAQLAARLSGRRFEAAGERSESSRTWANPDGTLTFEVATTEVRVRAADGSWRDVDATLSLSADGVRPAVLPVDVRFSPGGVGELARVGRGGRWFALSWPGSLPVPLLAGTRATYPAAAPGADVVLDVTRHGFEQSMVLRARRAVAPVFQLPVSASPGLSVGLDGRGGLRVTDAAGNVVVSGSVPVMYDATVDEAGAPARVVPLGVSLQGGRLVVTPDPAFLADPSVRYPVTLDPPAVMGRASDTFVESGPSAGTNFNSATELRVGLRNTASGILTQRPFVTFNTNSLVGKKIVSAEAKFWNYSAPNGCVGSTLFVNRVSGAWSPSAVTWNTQPGVDPASVDSSVQIYGATGCPANWITFSGSGFVDMIQQWADQTAGNYGFRLHSGESLGTTLGYRRLNSGEATGNTPLLSVTYNSYPGTVGGRSTQPCFACTAPVRLASVTPTLRGASPDADGGQVRVHFEVLNAAGTSVVVSGWSPWVSSNTNTSWTVPAGHLTNGTSYRWRARGYDGTSFSTSYSSLVDFTVDTTVPASPTASSSVFAQNGWSNANAADGSLDGSVTFGNGGSGDVVGYFYAVDANPPGRYHVAGAALPLDDVAEGPHTLYYRSVDAAGNRSAVQQYAFSVGHAGITAPLVGARTEAGLTLTGVARAAYPKARWKWRRAAADSWTVTTGLTDLSNNPVPQPLTVTAGVLPAVKWPGAGTAVGADGPFQLALDVLDANDVVQQTTQPRDLHLDRADFGSVIATEQVGPASVNLVTGNASLGATDATLDAFGSDLTVARTHNSRAPQGGGVDGPFGPQWVASSLVASAGSDYLKLSVAGSLATLTLSDGDTLGFTSNGGGFVPEYGAEDLTLRYVSASDRYELTDISGVVTGFTKPSGTADYLPTSVRQPADTAATSYAYETVDTDPTAAVHDVTRVVRMVAPQPAGVSCSSYATRGCRSLSFSYAANDTAAPGDTPATWGDYPNRLVRVSATMWDPDATPADMVTVDVARYAYDSGGRLRAVWDPRLTTPLKTTYAYDGGGRVVTVTPPGESAWTLGYDPADAGRLLTVARPKLPVGSGDAVTTLHYDVPVSGSGAPLDLSPAELDRTGQADRPTTATAVFPPDHPPGSPVDYTYATVHYLDVDGRAVNVRTPGDHLTTTEYDARGNVVRTLTAANRARALAQGATTADEAANALALSSAHVYSADGLDLLETFGPEHDVQLANGSRVRARAHTVNTYDEGAPTSGGPFHLVTTSVTGARVTGDTADTDTRTGKTEYDFAERLVTKTIVDPAGLNLRALTAYNSENLPVLTTLPGGLGVQTTAHTTKTVYYTAGTNADDAACGSRSEWVNLVCATGPAAQPTGTLPTIPTSYFTYDAYHQVRTKTEKTTTATLRTSTTTYDAAGRPDTVTVTASTGEPLPTVRTVYDTSTGRAVGTETIGVSPAVSVARGYDALGRLTSYDDATTAAAATYGYDHLGRPTSSYDGQRTTTRAYQDSVDPRGLLTQVVDPGAGTFTATYDADGHVATVGYPNGMTATWTYDETGSPVTVEYAKDGSVWLSDTVAESIHGQWLDHAGVSEQEFGYDAAGRLTHVRDTALGKCMTRDYTVDADSNRTGRTTYLANDDGTCQNTTSTTTSHTYDQAARAIDTGYGYDALGRTTTVPAAAATGNAAVTATYHVNDLARSLTQNGVTTTYTLDVLQERFHSWTDGNSTSTNHYTGDGDSPAWTEKSGTWTRNIPGPTGDLAAIETWNGTTSSTVLQLVNLHGDVVAEAVSGGTGLADTFDSDEFGNRRETSTRRYEWLGAKTRPADNPAGIVLMGVRLYNPYTGRFLSVDPILGGGDNPYDYVGHEPLNRHDLDGRKWKCHCKCQLDGPPGCSGRYIYGAGSGKTEADASKAGKKDCDQHVPAGCYKRHCKCDCTKNRLRQRLFWESDSKWRGRNYTEPKRGYGIFSRIKRTIRKML